MIVLPFNGLFVNRAILLTTQGTVLLKNATELKAFSTGEEELLEKQIQEIKDQGVSVVVSGGFSSFFCFLFFIFSQPTLIAFPFFPVTIFFFAK